MALSRAERDKRFSRGQRSARETIAAKEIFSLRLPPQAITRIYEIAANCNLHASDLVRNWIEDCIKAYDLQALPEKPKELNCSEPMVNAFRQAIRDELCHLGLIVGPQHPSETAQASIPTVNQDSSTGKSASRSVKSRNNSAARKSKA